MSFAFKTLALAAFLAPVAYGKNDWSKPCTSGACSYESGDGVNKAYSAMTIVSSCPRITASPLTLPPRVAGKHPLATLRPPPAGILWAVTQTGPKVSHFRVTTSTVTQFLPPFM